MPPRSGAAENGPVWRGPPCVRLAPSCARGSALRINCCAVNRYSTIVVLSRAPTAVMSEILGLRAVTRLANSRSSTPSIARLRSSTSSGLRRGTERTAAAGKVDGSPASFGPCAGVQILDLDGVNRSSASIPLVPVALRQVATGQTFPIENLDHLNRNGQFTYDRLFRFYWFALSTKALPTGAYDLEVTVAGQGGYAVRFTVK